LEKHQHEIINYKHRSQAGKTIGIARIEKGVPKALMGVVTEIKSV